MIATNYVNFMKGIIVTCSGKPVLHVLSDPQKPHYKLTPNTKNQPIIRLTQSRLQSTIS